MEIEARLATLGLKLPPPLVVAPHVRLPFAFVRVAGTRAYISGHGPIGPDGRVARPLGKVGVDLTVEQAYEAARLPRWRFSAACRARSAFTLVSRRGCGCSAW